MKRITKMFATLALSCVASVASAQEFVPLEVKGWVHEWNEDMTEQIDAEKLPDNDGVYSVYVRSSAEAEEAGNPTLDNNGNFADWDSQFFITWDEENALEEDDIIHVSFKYKADKTISGVSTQSHYAPGAYIHWACIGSIDFDTDWAEFDDEFTVGDAPRSGMWSIAFNLAKGEGYTCEFKDLAVERYHPAPVVIDEWTDLIINGDLSSNDMRCFYSKEYPSTDVLPSKIVDGAIVVNSAALVQYAWDSQFWIRLPQALPAGTKYKVKFDYKASADATVNTQMHAEPGDYIHYVGIGDVNFTTSWDTYEYEGKVSADQSTDSKAMHSIAFNLSMSEDMVYYFKNFSFEIPSDAVTEFDFPETPVETVYQDIIINGDMEGNEAICFYTKNAGEGAVISTIEDGIGVDGSRGVRVLSADRYETGEFDDDGNPVMEGYDWDAQFWIRLPQVVPAGTKMRVSFDYMATNDANVDTQCHNEPGQYIHWSCIGSKDFTTDWQHWEWSGSVPSECNGEEADGGYLKDFHSIAFNLSKNCMETEFYFDNVVVEIDEQAITEPDYPAIPFTIGESGWMTYGASMPVSFDDVDAYAAYYDRETGYVQRVPVYDVPAGFGVIINGEPGVHNANYYVDARQVYNELKVSDGTVVGDEASIYVLASKAEGESGFYLLKKDETLSAGKCYLEITGLTAAREFIPFGTTGVNAITAQESDNVIFNVAGQRVAKTQKGLYISNGKKIVK